MRFRRSPLTSKILTAVVVVAAFAGLALSGAWS